MAFLNPSNQLLQIDTGVPLTYLYNPSLSPVSVYAGIGENQVLGQRYFGANYSVSNPSGSPAIYMLVKYSSISNPAPVAAPAPVYWIDTTFTAVSGLYSEGFAGVQAIAGYLMPNTTSLPNLTATQLNGAQVLIQVAGYLAGAYAPTGTTGGAVAGGSWIIGYASGSWGANTVASGTAPGSRPYGVATSAVASGTFGLLLNCDII